MSTQKIQFKIVTPERTVFEDTIDQATLPVADGEVTILPNHQSYIGALKAGDIMIKTERNPRTLPYPAALWSLTAMRLLF